MGESRRPKRFDVASTGPDSVRITEGGYGTGRIATITKAEDASPEQWEQFKRWLIEAEKWPDDDEDNASREALS